MSVEIGIQYGSIIVALFALAFSYKGMKPYLPVAMLASLYANLWCYLAMYFDWWIFPNRILPSIKDISFTANIIVLPIMAMFWVRYCPMSRINWALLWTTALTGSEYLIERYSEVLEYHNGYNWYHSYFLWFISWFIWYWFHNWFYKDYIKQ